MATSPTDPGLNDFLGTKPPSRVRQFGKWALVALGVVLLALLLRHFLAPAAATSYATQPVERGDLTVTVSATGKLAPTNQVDVGSELSGLVTRVVVDVNDRVTKGQPLALIDPSTFEDATKQTQAQLAANRAAVAQAQATLDQSNATLQRFREVSRLSNGRVPAKTELDQAVADRERAVANLRAAQANVVSAQAALSSNVTRQTKTVIRSPVNGVILARQIEPGQTVAASFNTPTLFVIAEDLTTMKLEVAIDEADVGTVKTGQDASFTVDAFPGKTFPARITRVDLGSNLTASSSSSSSTTSSTTTANQVVSYAATLSVANQDLQLRPGMTATADIVTSSKKNVLLVPNAALRFRPPDATASAGASGSDNGGIAGALVPRRPRRGGGGAGDGSGANLSKGGRQSVYVKGADGKPQRVRVTIGESNGAMTEVTGGDLKPGQPVITGQLAGAGDSAGSGGRSGGGSGRRSGGGGGGQRGG